LKIVYKPRSLAVESHFQEVLTWLNQCGHQPAFRTLTLLDRGTYGWVEWIDAAECASEAEVRRFYQRQGAYLALLYALEATDFHMSNIIAAGEYPILIDLEALFHPRDIEPDWSSMDLALDLITYHSVLRLGLLPEPEFTEDETVGVFDQSGLVGAGGQRTPYTVPVWENKGTDIMRLVRKHKTIHGGKNLPTWHGRPVNVADYLEAIDEGFTSLYRFLIRRRDELLALQSSLLGRFVGDEVRVLPRSGRRYSALLEQSFHPDLMRDALDRDRFFDWLWQDVESEPYLAGLIPHEQADLLAGDIPLFTTRVGSRAVYNSAEKSIIACFFPCSGLEVARRRIAALDEADLARQRWFIKASMATVTARMTLTPTYSYVAPAATPADLQRQLLHQARAAGERLEQMALRVDGEVSWMGVALVDDRQWLVEPLHTDLYNGLPGVALFLAHLGAFTGDERWTALAQAAVATLRRFLAEEHEDGADDLGSIGAFNGLGGQLYTFAHLATLWKEPVLIGVVETHIERAKVLLQRPTDSEKPGLAHGIAGCLAGLLALYWVAPTPHTLEVARLVGDQLLRCIQAMPRDGDADLVESTNPFAHFLSGQVGTAWTLLALAEASGEDHYRTTASAILATMPLSEAATPGHWLAALRALRWSDDSRQQSALSAGLKATLPAMLAQDLGRNHSLGRGDLGYLDLLLQASAMLNDAILRHECDRYAAALVTHIQCDGWVTAVPLGVETPGLMTGLAGIGYGLLRLAAPERVPSVLALELPGNTTEVS
jgi:type 2 lantibiotic biosynthesis protein LanM